MKLFDLLQQMDGMGQGEAVYAANPSRPLRLRDLDRRQTLARVATVMVETWDTGPFATDVTWLLADAEGCILFVLPTGRIDGKPLLDRIGNNPGFDKKALRKAMKSTRHARFTVWQRAQIAA